MLQSLTYTWALKQAQPIDQRKLSFLPFNKCPTQSIRERSPDGREGRRC